MKRSSQFGLQGKHLQHTWRLETVVSTTNEGAQPQAPVAFTEPTTLQYLPKEATQPLGKRNEHSTRAAARMHARVDPLERGARALQDCKMEK